MEHGPPYDPSVWLHKRDIWRSITNDGSMNKFVNIDPKDCGLKLEDSHHMLIIGYIQGFTLGTRKRGKNGFIILLVPAFSLTKVLIVWLQVDDLEQCKSSMQEPPTPLEDLHKYSYLLP